MELKAEKQKINEKLYRICTLSIFRLMHWATLLALLLFFIYDSMRTKNVTIFYAILVIAASPLFFRYLLQNAPQKKKKEEDSIVLPILSKKYGYDAKNRRIYHLSFWFESLMLCFLQLGNILYPDDNPYVRCAPFVLLVCRLLFILPLIAVFRAYLRHKLTNNKL